MELLRISGLLTSEDNVKEKLVTKVKEKHRANILSKLKKNSLVVIGGIKLADDSVISLDTEITDENHGYLFDAIEAAASELIKEGEELIEPEANSDVYKDELKEEEFEKESTDEDLSDEIEEIDEEIGDKNKGEIKKDYDLVDRIIDMVILLTNARPPVNRSAGFRKVIQSEHKWIDGREPMKIKEIKKCGCVKAKLVIDENTHFVDVKTGNEYSFNEFPSDLQASLLIANEQSGTYVEPNHDKKRVSRFLSSSKKMKGMLSGFANKIEDGERKEIYSRIKEKHSSNKRAKELTAKKFLSLLYDESNMDAKTASRDYSDLIDRIAFDRLSVIKDKDLMRDTGGKTKHERYKPTSKPPRDDCRKYNRKRRLREEEKEEGEMDES